MGTPEPVIAVPSGHRTLILLVLLAAQASASASNLHDPAIVLQPGFSRLPPPINSTTAALQPQGSGAVALKLCECERATGSPNGLSCDKEGWFISSFERQGQWVAGGGYVPLSPAICCRPCLPDELPPDPSGRIPPGQTPLAVVSLGCHPTTDRVLPTRCEERAGSFVVGYSEAVKVFSTPGTYYPINTVHCCTPALLLENGDAWELERCECRDSGDHDFPVNCGGTNTDELLLGYLFFRLSPLGHVVPVGPAQCCKACLSSTVHPMNQCDDLNACSDHGVCNMRRCECFDGWTGADCSQAESNNKSMPPWAIALIVLSSSALAGVFIIAAGYALQALGVAPGVPAGSEDGESDERQPLLIRIDADDAGSVGSADTTDAEDEVDVDEVERRVNRALQRLAGAAGGAPAAEDAAGGAAAAGSAAAVAEGQTEGQAAADGEGGGEGAGGVDIGVAAEADAGGGGGAGTGQQQGPAGEAREGLPASPEAAAAAAAAVAAAAELAGDEAAGAAAGAAGREEEEDEPVKPPWAGSCGPTPEGPLAMVDCSVCMSRPVQVVIVPCGHVCMCRRCSRRLNRCPMCRKEIARRQRLFV